MDKVRTTNDGLYLAGIMLDFINSYDKKLSYINLEEFSDELPAMVMQQLTSAVIEKQYIRKDCYIGNWAFAVYIRIRNADTRDRIDAGAAYPIWLNGLERLSCPIYPASIRTQSVLK